jgi:REP element-mobilizing transposase RayT
MIIAQRFIAGNEIEETEPVPLGTAERKEVKTMSHSYISQLMHCVFSTKERRKLIVPDLQERLHPFMGGIARQNNMKALAIGGVEDHVHLLLSLPATMPVAKAIQLIKGGSSKWVHEEFPQHRDFAWQEGYGAFSISVSHVKDTIAYIERQAEHHRRKSFQEEFLAFLKKHGIEYDERYIWD